MSTKTQDVRNVEVISQQFRYEKGEILFGLAGMTFFFVLLLLEFLISYDPKFASHKMTKGDIYSEYLYRFACIGGIVYFLFIWLKRFTLKIIMDSNAISLVTWYKKQRIDWPKIKSIIYHNNSPWHYLALYPINGKPLIVAGELKGFIELLSIVKSNIRYNHPEFHYSIRKKIAFLINMVFVIIMLLVISLAVIKGTTWYLGLQSLLLIIGFSFVIFLNIRWSSDLLVTDEQGLTMIRLGKRIKIFWKDITNKTQISCLFAEPSWRAVAMGRWKAEIRSNEKMILFCSDLDNVDDLLENILKRTKIDIIAI